jgi:hypothetical protein
MRLSLSLTRRDGVFRQGGVENVKRFDRLPEVDRELGKK